MCQGSRGGGGPTGGTMEAESKSDGKYKSV